MRRREFIGVTAGAAVWPLHLKAQQPAKTAKIGVLRLIAPDASPSHSVFQQSLRELGYEEGRNVTIEVRWPQVHPESVTALAAELVQMRVDIIVAGELASAVAAMRATTLIPIVVAVFATDPVAAGLVKSLSHPGGNVTGLSLLAPEVSAKRLELMRNVVPGLSRVVVLWSPHAPQHTHLLRETDQAARQLGLALVPIAVPSADDLDRAFQSAEKERVGAMTVLQASQFAAMRARIAELGLKYRLPTISGETGFAQSGGLMTYGPGVDDLWRRAASYVDRILKGAKPGDLPIEQPTKIELVINLKTAKAVGIEIPREILARADEVIE
jgi:putative tryptophan/tyrosine transport system substrate-binding protein